MYLKDLRSIFRGKKYSREVKTSCEDLTDSVAHARMQHQELQASYNMMAQMVHAVGGFLWKKDCHGRYQFANRSYFRRVLKPDIVDKLRSSNTNITESVSGKNDEELFGSYAERSGNPHSFAPTMKAADAYVIETGQSCRFLELGRIGNNPMMLKSTRTPTFNPSGNLGGIVGFAMDEGEWWAYFRQGLDWYLADSNTRQIGPGLYLLRQEPESPSEVSETLKGVFRADQRCVLPPDASTWHATQ